MINKEFVKRKQEKIYSSIADCLNDYNEYCERVLNFLEVT
jgi:hypothetical protein